MKKFAFVFLFVSLLVASCTRDEFDLQTPPTGETKLLGKQNGFAAKELVNNDTFSGGTGYYYFWTNPATAVTFVLEDSARTSIIYQSATPETATDFRRPLTRGQYWLTATASGFVRSNIRITVTSGTTPPVTPSISPVKIKGVTLSGGNVLISVGVNKSELNNVSGSGAWFYVSRVNGQNFAYGAVTSVSGDSVFYTMTIPQTNGAVLEFNDGKYDASNQPIWQVASSTLYNCILYDATAGVNYWKMSLTLTSNYVRLYAPNGTMVYQTTTMAIPGSNGDDSSTHWIVRMDGGYDLWYYDTVSADTVFRWRLGSSGTWSHLTTTPWSSNTAYHHITWPSSATGGQIQFQWGRWNSGVFAVSGNLTMSRYIDASLSYCFLYR